MLKILYFAGLQEQIGLAEQSLERPPAIDTLGQLRDYLVSRYPGHACLATAPNLKVARNQELARFADPFEDGDEIAFFPPVTGG